MTGKKKIVIYARYSSDRQTEQSIEGQLRVCHEYAERNDYVVIREYIDRAISGTTDNRPEFLRMIEDSKRKDFEFVLVYQLDRFSRSRYDSANYKMKLKKNGVRVLSARENISDDASGILMESVLEGMAEYYSAELSQKVKRGRRETLSKKLFAGGITPYGYRIENQKWIIDESEAPQVRQMFDLYSQGYKTVEIADMLNNAGLRNRLKKPFYKKNIAKILKNERYIGIERWNNEVYTDIIPPIVDERVFKIVGGMIANYRRNYKRNKYDPYFLSGKLYCGYCGEKLIAEAGSSAHNGHRYKYYKCRSKKVKKQRCELENFRKWFLEDLIIEKTKNHILAPGKIDELAQMVVDKFNEELENNIVLKCLNRELAQVNASINSILSNIQNGIVNSSVKEILYKLENDRANIEVKISEEKGRQAQPLEFEGVKKFITMFTKKDYSDIYERNEFFCRFIKKVIMFNDKMIIIYNGNFNPASEVSIDNNEAYEKQIIEKLKQKKDCLSDNPLNFNKKIPLMTQSVLMGLDGGATWKVCFYLQKRVNLDNIMDCN